ncbi:MAG: hypothetical protein JST86_19805 [Bacteroidetes bacterium]|nr:hypothetical protein [Bacteroidota bacterium]
MNGKSKLMLSDGELQLVRNTAWILTKRKIIETAVELLGAVAAAVEPVLKNAGLPPEVAASTPKISKGENYRQLPYVILDYPRCFGKADVFAVRSMFWWGNGFSCTLQLAGKYKEKNEKIIAQKIPLLQEKDVFICVNTDPWEHHFEAGNYLACKQLPSETILDILTRQQFIKLAVVLPLDEWNRMEQLLEKAFAEMIQLLL